jgi:hypothetical protein
MNMDHNLSDRRKHARFELMDYAILTKDGDTESTRSVIVDISLGGLQVRSRTPFCAGAKYKLEIGRGNANPILIHAEALHSKPIEEADLFSTGFRLTPATAMERIEWVEYVHCVFKVQGEMLTG